MTQSNERINQIAAETFKSAKNVILIYAKSAKSTLIKVVAASIIALSFWTTALALFALAIHDAVVRHADAHNAGVVAAAGGVCLLLSIFSAWLGFLAATKRQTTEHTPAYQTAY